MHFQALVSPLRHNLNLMKLKLIFVVACVLLCYAFIGQWTQNAIKHQMCSCRHTIHTHPVRRTQHIRTIERDSRIPVNVCPARTSNTQHPVHMKSDVFKHHVVFQKRPSLREGKQLQSIDSLSNRLQLIFAFLCSILGVMSREHHTVTEHKTCHRVAVAVGPHLGL